MNRIYVSGHRNPDCDSIMSACALADLRRRTGLGAVEALCPGRLPDRAKWVFDRFGIAPPPSRSDVYVRVADIIAPGVESIPGTMPLLEALKRLEASGESSLPVATAEGGFAGMLSPVKLLNYFIGRRDLSVPVATCPLHSCTQVLQAADRVHDVKGACLGNSHNHFPVVDDRGRLLGTVLKRAFAEPPPFRMILVDHNEVEQGIPGEEEIPIIEVVDHHRIAFGVTAEPIRYTADTVGSTCTIVTRMFRAAGERPTRPIAGLLLAGIVADTLLFQSPTATADDRAMAAWLEKLCGATAQEIMDGMMSVASALVSLTPAKAVESDCKTYRESGFSFALAQLEETNLALFRRSAAALAEALAARREAEKLDFAGLLVTDPVRGNSEFLYCGAEDVRRALPWRHTPEGIFLLPGVLSRKKQLLPQILSAVSGLRA